MALNGITDECLKEIQTHLSERLSRAEKKRKSFFDSNENDVTTSILTELSTDGERRTVGDFNWRIQVTRPDSTGENSESGIGADGIIQIKIYDTNKQLIESKGLLFQAKKTSNTHKDQFVTQKDNIIKTAGEDGAAIFIYDKEKGFFGGKFSEYNFADIKHTDRFQDLESILVKDFLECKIGRKGLRYNQNSKKLHRPLQEDTEVSSDDLKNIATIEVGRRKNG